MIAYTLNRLLTQQAVLQRDTAQLDNFGGLAKVGWQPYITVPARLFWYRSEGLRSSQREYADQERLIPLQIGGLIVPLDTNVTETDQVASVLNADGTVYVAGPFQITAALNVETHMELALYRSHLGA